MARRPIKQCCNLKRKLGSCQLTNDETVKTLRDLLLTISRQEQVVEVLRQFLCANANFEPYSAFCRLDRDQDGFV